MKKRFIALVAAAMTLALSAVLLAGCQGGSNSTSSSDSGAKDGQFTLIVGFDQNYPPYGFQDDSGQLTGFDLDLAKAVADKMGWGIELKPIEWSAKDAELGSGTINCIWNGFTMEGREDGYTFSEPYMLNEQVVVVRAGDGISSLDDLAGKNVITQLDSAAQDVLEGDKADLAATFAGGAAQTISDYDNAFVQLDSHLVDAVACDLSIAQFQIAGNPGKFEQISEPLSTEHYAVGFKKGDTELADQVTNALKELDEEGVVKELCDKYASYGISYDNWVLA